MKSLLIGFVCLISHSTHALDIGSSECYNIQQNERPRIAQEIYDHKPIVPSVIYHFGKKDYLLQGVEANTIPLDVWKNNIMGKKSRYNLPEARKGLYGTSTISSNSYYLDGHNWLMAIKIKDECLVPERVTSFFDLSKNKQFLDWFSLKYTNMNFESFEKTCPLDKIRKDLFSNEFCNQVANEYLVENNIAIVHDHVLNSSFYIRDRNCIESISGSAEQIIEMLANDKSHFETNCLGVSNVSSLPVLIYDALKSSKKTYSWSQLWKLKSNINYLKKNNYEDVTDEMMNTQYDYFVVGNYLRFKLLSYPFNIKNYRQ